MREVGTAPYHDDSDTIKGMPIDYLGISHSTSPFNNQKAVIKLNVEGHEIDALMGMIIYATHQMSTLYWYLWRLEPATSIEGKEKATSEIFDCLSKRHV